MSSREHLIERVEESLASTARDAQADAGLTEWVVFAEAVVDALLPQITKPEQLLGVPEGSHVMVPVYGGAVFMQWHDGMLWGGELSNNPDSTSPQWVIERYGPLTVVWQP